MPFQTIGAIFAVVVAGPVLLVVTAFLLIVILFGGCMVAMVVVYPFVEYDQYQEAAEARAKAALDASIEAQPLPANIELFIRADDWKISPSGQYLLIREQMAVFIVDASGRSRQQLSVKAGVSFENLVWLDDQHLFVSQSYNDFTGYQFAVFVLTPEPDFSVQEVQLPGVRANNVVAGVLQDKMLFQNDDPHSWQVVVIGQSESQVIDAYSDPEREAFDQLMANQPVTKVPFYPGRANWRSQEAVYAPDGNYYAAVWPNGAQLAIMESEGEVLTVTEAADLGPPAADCRLQPIGWFPESEGVLFAADCGRIKKSILQLPVPKD